jgi:hypothetical protein
MVVRTAEEKAAAEARQKEIDDKKKEAALSVLEKTMQPREKRKEKKVGKEKEKTTEDASVKEDDIAEALVLGEPASASSSSAPAAVNAPKQGVVTSGTIPLPSLTVPVAPSTSPPTTQPAAKFSVAAAKTPAAVGGVLPFAAAAGRAVQSHNQAHHGMGSSAAAIVDPELNSLQDFPPLGASEPATPATPATSQASKASTSWASAAAVSGSSSTVASGQLQMASQHVGPTPVFGLNNSNVSGGGHNNNSATPQASVPGTAGGGAGNISLQHKYRQQDADELKTIATQAFEYRPSPEVMLAAEAKRQALLKEQQQHHYAVPVHVGGTSHQRQPSGSSTNGGITPTSPVPSSLSAHGDSGSLLPNSTSESLYDPIFDSSLLSASIFSDLGITGAGAGQQSAQFGGMSGSSAHSSASHNRGGSLMSDSLGSGLGGGLFGDNSRTESRLGNFFGGKHGAGGLTSNVSRAASFGFNILDTLGADTHNSLNEFSSSLSLNDGMLGGSSSSSDTNLTALSGSTNVVPNSLSNSGSNTNLFQMSSIDEQIRQLTSQIPGSASTHARPSSPSSSSAGAGAPNSGGLGLGFGGGYGSNSDAMMFGGPLASSSRGNDNLMRTMYPSEPYPGLFNSAPSSITGGPLGASQSTLFGGLGSGRRPSPGPLGGLGGSLSLFDAPGMSSMSGMTDFSLSGLEPLGLTGDSLHSFGGSVGMVMPVPESMFPSAAWLRSYDMHIYHWNPATDVASHLLLTEHMNTGVPTFAVHMPKEYLPYLFDGPESVNMRLQEMIARTQCNMWLDEEMLRGSRETFLVLYKDLPSSASQADPLMTAVDLISLLMRQVLTTIASTQSHGLLGMSGSGISSISALLSGASSTSFASKVAAAGMAAGSPNRGLSVLSGSNNGFSLDANSVVNSLFGSDSNSNTPNSSVASITSPENAGVSPQTPGFGAGLGQGGLSAPKSFMAKNVNPPHIRTKRPELLTLLGHPHGHSPTYIHRGLEIPRETVGMIIGHGGKKIKDLSALSGAKIQFKVRPCVDVFVHCCMSCVRK